MKNDIYDDDDDDVWKRPRRHIIIVIYNTIRNRVYIYIKIEKRFPRIFT